LSLRKKRGGVTPDATRSALLQRDIAVLE